MKLGDHVRYLKYKGHRFAVFDKTETVLVLPSEGGSQFAVWISLPSLAAILASILKSYGRRGNRLFLY